MVVGPEEEECEGGEGEHEPIGDEEEVHQEGRPQERRRVREELSRL